MAERYSVDALAPQYEEIYAICSEGRPVILTEEEKELVLLSPDEFRKMIQLAAKGQEALKQEESKAEEPAGEAETVPADQIRDEPRFLEPLEIGPDNEEEDEEHLDQDVDFDDKADRETYTPQTAAGTEADSGLTATAVPPADAAEAIRLAINRRSQIPMDPVPEGLAIETEDLTRKYGGNKVNNSISLHVPYGAIYGLAGMNGAGKSTLVRSLLGLTRPSSGHILLLERSGRELNDVLELTGSIVEVPTFYEMMTINQNMVFRAKMLRLKSPKAAIKDALKRTGLFDRKRRKVRTLSDGDRQCLAMAMAILGNPELLILDEPFRGLDPVMISRMQDLLLDLNSHGMTILICDHQLSNLWPIATHYGVLKDGDLVTEVSAAQILENQIDLDKEYLQESEV